jgi:hypothetical protein
MNHGERLTGRKRRLNWATGSADSILRNSNHKLRTLEPCVGGSFSRFLSRPQDMLQVVCKPDCERNNRQRRIGETRPIGKTELAVASGGLRYPPQP